MSRLGQPRPLIGAMLMLFLPVSGCSRPTPGVPIEGAASSFEDRRPNTPAASSESAALLQKNVSGSGLPFGSSEMLPPGTLITVRLKSPLIAENDESNATFEAVFDEAVIADGNTLIPRGSVASGRVGAVRISNLRPDRGYVRLTLESVSLDGLDLAMKTANLFARQKSGDLRSGTIRLEKGRRLTFQLTEAFNPEAERVSASH